jgi:predicted secreted Zn-dependent protease
MRRRYQIGDLSTMTQQGKADTFGWRRSSFCNNGTCVEVGYANGNILVRDSKNAAVPSHSYTADEWQQFIAGVKNGEFDVNQLTR